MTFFALAGKCVRGKAAPWPVSSARLSLSKDASAAKPTALTPRPRNWRRDWDWSKDWKGVMEFLRSAGGSPAPLIKVQASRPRYDRSLIQHLVQVHQLID